MNEYDTTLKLLFQSTKALRQLTGIEVETWSNVELPRVQNPRVDLLGETRDGELAHVEFQSWNDPTMAHRMAEYYLAIYRRLGRYPSQTVIFVGDERLRMQARLESPAMTFHYRLIDIRDLDGGSLIASSELADNIISLLTRAPDSREVTRQILKKIGESKLSERETALRQLLIIAGLRGLEQTVEEEARKVPVLNDILENKVLGREYKRGIAEGKQEGRLEGELTLLRRQLQSRFGAFPSWVEARLAKSSSSDIEIFGTRLLDPKLSLEEVLEVPAT
ncbi:MAG TPA: DUF4351 domain-containing protein [Blastocatellia bacterium]